MISQEVRITSGSLATADRVAVGRARAAANAVKGANMDLLAAGEVEEAIKTAWLVMTISRSDSRSLLR